MTEDGAGACRRIVGTVAPVWRPFNAARWCRASPAASLDVGGSATEAHLDGANIEGAAGRATSCATGISRERCQATDLSASAALASPNGKHVPARLRPAFEGKREVWRSLGTRDRREAERRFHAAMAKLDAEYQAAEASLRAAERAAEREVRAMDSPRIDAALDEFAKIANRIGLYGPSFAPRPTSPDQQDFIRLALITGQLSERPKTRAEAMRMVDRALEQLDGLEAESAHGVHVVVGRDEDGEPSYTVPDHLIGDLREWAAERFGATRRTLEAIRARFEEAAEADEEQPGSASKGPEAPDARLADLIGRWGRERSPGAKTRQEMRHAVACFERVNGPLPFRRITDEHARRFKDDLLGDGVIKAATMAKLWSMVGTLMRVARHDDLVAAHPFERVKLGRLKDDAARREDFSRGDLEAVFAALNGEERWIARLALYTGARLGEPCQLTKADLAERDGVAFLRIRAAAAKGQRVKNRNSARDVPLHRQLLADGFVAWAASRPGERLFSFSSAVARKRLLRRFEAMGLGEGKVVHSLRHTFKTAARGMMGQEWHDALTGHAGASVSNSYGCFPVPDLRAKIDLVAFGIELA